VSTLVCEEHGLVGDPAAELRSLVGDPAMLPEYF
jgi:hypothetical protein